MTDINKNIKNCTKCRLHKTRTNPVCGEGNLKSDLFFLGQAPGEIEDREDKMFVGPSGKKLDHLLEESGINRHDVYITNLLKCILPKSRKPRRDEINSCSFFLEQELMIVSPKVIIPLGFHSTRYILDHFNLDVPNKNELPKIFGDKIYVEDQVIFPLRHPSVLVHNPQRLDELIINYKKLNQIVHDNR